MLIKKKYGNYEKYPITSINGMGAEVITGIEQIITMLNERKSLQKTIFVFDLYPGTEKQVVSELAQFLQPHLIIDTDNLLLSQKELETIFKDNLSDDRVFGYMCHKNIDSCFDQDKVELTRAMLHELEQGVVVLIGTGASLVTHGDILVYFDLSRWEIQQRYRNGDSNWLLGDGDEPFLEKYKRGFFIEWRLADRHKMNIFDQVDFFLDSHTPGVLKMVSGESIRSSLKQIAKRPFRLEPFFDPGIWGGQWMKEQYSLDKASPNYAWSFDGIPEENCINIGFENGSIKMPAINLVLYCPRQLLGERVHGRFGAEFPIRFDLLDTMGGQNLSLQVHPLTEYIQHEFGMNYTQDESYYILDAAEGAFVYIGLKEGIQPLEMEHALYRAQNEIEVFDAEKYVNKIPVKKHDHILIPAGTVHCSGANTMVLEISATPYIFTFKLWDWGRKGLDGQPRPTHIEHGIKNIQWDRTAQWIHENLIHQEEILEKNENFIIEKTGLHPREFICTYRYTIFTKCCVNTEDSVHCLNLVEGERALIVSVDNSFEPFEIHYTETVIIPASVGSYEIVSVTPNKPIQIICAMVG